MGYGGVYSEQEAWNLLYNGSISGLSDQAVVNRQSGFTDHQFSIQTILNRNLGVADARYTTQEALWLTLQGDLGLTGTNHFQYSIQTLLNMAINLGGVTLPEVIDDDVVGGGMTGQPMGLLLSLTYA